MRTAHEDKSLSVSETKAPEGPVSEAARRAADALSAYTAGRACPLCGTTGKHCRPVSSVSYWCQASGLIASEAAYVHTEPDPQAEQVRNDAARRAAEMVKAAAQQVFEEADVAWRDAVAAVERTKAQAYRSEPDFDQNAPTGFRASRAAKQLAKSVPGLEAAAEAKKRIRNERAIDLDAATVAYQRATDDALERAGLPRVGGNAPSSDLRTMVGGSW